MTTVIIDGHAVDRVTRELTDDRARTVTAVLRTFGLQITLETDVFGVVHLWAQQPTDRAAEVRVIAAFKAVTDSPLAWHEAVRS